MNYPQSRNRRLRTANSIRSIVEETKISIDDFILPVFVVEGKNKKIEIPTMPEYFKYSVENLLKEIEGAVSLGIKSFLLFAEIDKSLKDNEGKEAYNPEGLMQKTIRSIKSQFPEICLMSDVALDPYSIHGHDGIVQDQKILNDETNTALAMMAISHAEAGVDFVAPSDMMDGRVKLIREQFDSKGYIETGIMSYSAKYASSFYGPFRDALNSAPGFGDKSTYQMNPANKREALNEVLKDIHEGADIVMVKPAIHYLDVISEVKKETNIPVSAYHVSGEYAMLKAAAKNGWVDEQKAKVEATISIKRAGADIIASYFAKDISRLLKEI